MGSTRPRSVSSPVIAVSPRTHLHHPKASHAHTVIIIIIIIIITVIIMTLSSS